MSLPNSFETNQSKTAKTRAKPDQKVGFFGRIWQIFLLTVGAEQFVRIFAPWVRWLAFIAAVLMTIGTVWGLAFAPPDYFQGNSYRIIFVHVPSASLAMSIYLAMAVLGVIFLVWKIKVANVIAQALAPMGLVACVLALLTGSIWAKPTWGKYWVWDARLTSMLILAFLYVGVIALFKAFEHTSNRGKPAAVLSVVGAINLPIIKYSVEWWNTLHQGATFTVTRAPKMPVEMWMPLLLMLIAGYCLVAAITIYRTNTLLMTKEQGKAWVKRLMQHNDISNPKD